MAKPFKKKGQLSSPRGRPKQGALSSYPQVLRDLISKLRKQHGGWGAKSIRLELELSYGYHLKDLPSPDAIGRYLKQKGFIKLKEPKGIIPSANCSNLVKRFHDLWEMDAQGTIAVKGIGYHSMINIKDNKSKVYCMSFPVYTKRKMSQPKTISYYWALRLAFEEFGLPRTIQVDKDSVFIDNTSKSPFPSRIHLFLIGLGIKLCFIDVPPPRKQAIVERSHQTIDGQVTKGQEYRYWKGLFQNTNKRRKVLNENYPSRSLNNKAPLVAFPKAKHSGRSYSVETEQELINLKHIFKYLAKCVWYRKISSVKTVSLDSCIYYLKNAIPRTHVQIKFCNRSKKLIFRDVNELVIAKVPIKKFSKEKIMGATNQQLIVLKKKLFHEQDFPL